MHHANRQPRSLISMSPIGMRVLVAFEDLRSLHRELFVRAILESRPTLKVPSASLEELAHVLSHFEPHVVVCAANPGSSGAWVQISQSAPRRRPRPARADVLGRRALVNRGATTVRGARGHRRDPRAVKHGEVIRDLLKTAGGSHRPTTGALLSTIHRSAWKELFSEVGLPELRVLRSSPPASSA